MPIFPSGVTVVDIETGIFDIEVNMQIFKIKFFEWDRDLNVLHRPAREMFPGGFPKEFMIQGKRKEVIFHHAGTFNQYHKYVPRDPAINTVVHAYF